MNTADYFYDKDYSYQVADDTLQVTLPSGMVLQLPLPGINLKAATSAIVASQCLQEYLPITVMHLEQAMNHVSILGRQQIVSGSNKTVLDVAHNPQAVLLLANFIGQFPIKGKVHAVFSGLKDKDLCGLIKPMLFCVDFWYPAVLDGKRAASESQILGAFAAENCWVPTCFSNPMQAYHQAMKQAKPDDLIIVYGSFLTVSAIMIAGFSEKESQ